MKVFITRKFPGEPEKYLRKEGFKVEVYNSQDAIPRELFLKKTKNADAVLAVLSEKVDKEAIDNFKNCKIVANCAVGYNNIDVNYAKEKKLIVTNTPDVLTDATADLTVGLILACARNFYKGEKTVREQLFTGFKPFMLLGMELKNKTVGIIGAGRIGQATAKRLHAFGTKIIYYSRTKNSNFEKAYSAKYKTLNSLIATSDIISVHLPLNSSTHHILNKQNLKLMKKSAIIVNTSRGEVIDELPLISMLQKKKIFAAGLDVYENEPNVNSKLLELDNVYLLPHLGSATFEARSAMSLLAARNIVRVLKGKSPITPIAGSK